MLMDFKIYLLTWNVVGRPPVDDLRNALGIEDPVDVLDLPDVYALGLQEVSCMPHDFINDMIFEDPWVTGFKEVLCKLDYIKIKQIRLQGILLFIFAKREHILHIRNVQTSYTRAGLKGMWGNKGGVSIRFSAYGCSICIVNSHLAAHDTELQQRIDDYNLIVDKQRFIDPLTENIITHDYTFWIGDLNFRIDDFNSDEIKQFIENKSLSDLLNKDQLRKVMKLGHAFSEFVETTPSFAPTYKFAIDQNVYDTRKRKPAWTDRILFRSTPNAYENVTLSLKQLHYGSHPYYSQSDHKPVTSSFLVKVFSHPEEKRVTFLPISQWKINDDSVAWYYFTGGEPTNWDWIALYRADFCSVDEHVAYVWAPVRPTNHTPPTPPSTQQNCVSTPSLANSCNHVNGPSRPLQSPWYRVVFADQTILIPGRYRLFYICSEFDNIIGISDSFEVLP